MPHYVTLLKFTPTGLAALKNSPKRADDFKKVVQAAGGEVLECTWLMGEYDGLIRFEAPDGETTAALMAGLAMAGNVTTQTFRAFNGTEFAEVLKKAK